MLLLLLLLVWCNKTLIPHTHTLGNTCINTHIVVVVVIAGVVQQNTHPTHTLGNTYINTHILSS